jgi:hypothetical protein
MMGIKLRVFEPVESISLEELVPTNQFYRHLEQILDLAFVPVTLRCWRTSIH